MTRQRLLPLAALLLSAAAPLSAQQVMLQLREEGSQAPIGGAIVRLLADSGVVAQGLTNEGGRITLRAPAPGRYRVKADRIGWIGILSGEIELAAGQILRSEMVMPTTRLDLPTIEVRTRSRCDGRGRGGTEALAVWEEIQKALTANLITVEQGAIPLHVREFRRWLQRNGNPVREYNVVSTIMRGQVYASLPPASLAEFGFVLTNELDSLTYAVPDAALLISDDFAATHCFGLAPSDEGMVGLTFEPAPGRRLPDVAGTFWVDRSTGELKFLEYRYTELAGILGRADLGGRVEYQRLPSGHWIVSYWHVRTPDIASIEVRGVGNVRREMPRHVGYLDLGGRVTMAGDELGRIHLALVQGRVTDGTADGAGLPGAVIRVEGSDEQVVTDHEGRYELAVPLFGERTVTATHHKLGLVPGPQGVTWLLSLGDTTRADFAVPPMASFTRTLCGSSTSNRSGVVGLVLSPDTVGVEGLDLRASWRTASGGTREARARTGRRGVFALCDLPAEEQVTIRVFNRNQPVIEQAVEVPFRSFTWLDLRMPGLATPDR